MQEGGLVKDKQVESKVPERLSSGEARAQWAWVETLVRKKLMLTPLIKSERTQMHSLPSWDRFLYRGHGKVRQSLHG
jgi:hypothetical protein